MKEFNCPQAKNCELMQHTLDSICENGHVWESEHTSFIGKILESSLTPDEKLVAAYLFRQMGAGCDPQCAHKKQDLVQKISDKMHISSENVAIAIGKFYLNDFIRDTKDDMLFVNTLKIWVDLRKEERNQNG
jgi:uridine kinase